MGKYLKSHKYQEDGKKDLQLLIKWEYIHIKDSMKHIQCLLQEIQLNKFGQDFKQLIKIYLLLKFYIVQILKLNLEFL